MSKGIKQFNRALRYANTTRSYTKEYKDDVKAIKALLQEREELEAEESNYLNENKRFCRALDLIINHNALEIIRSNNYYEEYLAWIATYGAEYAIFDPEISREDFDFIKNDIIKEFEL